MKRTIQTLLLILLPLYLAATHIVGGEMNYRCLGNNQYEISLTVFRDCDTGVPWFDQPASIGVFDGVTNAFMFQTQVFPTNNDTLPIYLPDPCLAVPSNVCIHTTTYYATITLNTHPNGYIIAYQRCCRNQDILNIVTPDAMGATYWTYVSPEALAGCNNSAVFREWPRVYLCSGVPISFDHSAIDLDGDSLVYELCTPSHGASATNPQPSPSSFPPPFPLINWSAPYSLNNMFGGADPLTIDPTTGLLTGTPQNLGVFLVGVCLKEYRNGVLISITRRDFQHVVGICGRMTIADFDTTGLQCNTNLTFPFDNNSQVVTGTYRWNFDVLGTSTAVNPVFTFPDTGTYTITLIAGIGSPCIDTFEVEMDIDIEAIQLSITPPQTVCYGDTVQLVATNFYEGYTDFTNYVWSTNTPIIAGQGTNSIWVVATQNTTFQVTATNSYGCTTTASTSFNTQQINAAFTSSMPTCNTTLLMQFQNTSTSNPANNNYSWNFDNLGSSTALNPSFTFPDTGTYTIMLIAGNGSSCPDTFLMDVNVQITGINVLPIPSQMVCQGDSVWINTTELYENYNSSNYTWTPSSAIAFGQGTDSVLIIANNPVQIYVSAINSHGCSDSVNFNINVVQVEALFDTINLACNISLAIPFINNSTSNLANNNILWVFDNLGTSTTQNPVFTFPDTGNYTVLLIAGVGSLCPDTMTWDLYLPLYGVDLLNIAPPTICQGDDVWLKVVDLLENYSDSIQYTWTPSAAILAGQGTDSVLVAPNSTMTIQVAAINNHLCQDSTTVTISIVEVEAAFDTVSLICNTSLILPFINNSTSNLPVNNYQWSFDTLASSTLTSPTYTFPDTGTYTVQLVAGVGSLCPDTIAWDFYLPLFGVNLLDINPPTVCQNDSTWLKVIDLLEDYSDSIQYTWTPSSAVLAGQGTDSILVMPNTNMTIQVTALNNHFCRDTTMVLISILEVAAAFDTVELICNTTFEMPFINNSTSNFTTNGFQWLFDNLGTSTAANPTYIFPDTGTYLIQLIADAGGQCPDTFSRNVYLPLHGLEISANDVQLLCKGDTVLLVAVNSLEAYTDFTNYDWSPQDLIIAGQGSDSANAVVYTDTSFTVTAINSHGCMDTAYAQAEVLYVSPTVDITTSPDSIFVGQTAQLWATNDINYIYNWMPDTTLSDYFIYNPEVRPRQTTTYFLTATNQFGCTDNDSVIVIIRQPICGDPVIFVPNAFSPDGDGHNDVLMVNGNNIDQLNMAIYNRWGQKVFETNDQNIGWDGTFKGQPLPPDVYGYYMQCTCNEGGKLFLKGNITLLK